ncbi:MAG: MATE family efflux transporter [Gammaproteobacteria bacterium]|nr:MATE family efflux transporter [Gammaproteobacteria bacterium]
MPRPIPRLLRHAWQTFRLAVPVMVSRVGMLVMIAVDTAMTGHASAIDLAAYGLASAVQQPLMLVGIGFLTGTLALVAHAVGARQLHAIMGIWRAALIHALVIGTVLMLLCLHADVVLRWFGQNESMVQACAPVLRQLGFGLPAVCVYVTSAFVLEGTGRALPGVLVMFLANLLNVAVNWVLIFGHSDLPAMGATGAALGTTLARWFAGVALCLVALLLLRNERARGAAVDSAAPAPTLHAHRRAREDANEDSGPRLRRLGLPFALAHGLESSAFASMVQFAGLLGVLHVSAYQIGMSVLTLVFMLSLGISIAASIRVGQALGRGDLDEAALAGWGAAALSIVLLCLAGICIWLFGEPLARIYTDDEQLIPLVVATFTVVAFAIVPDGLQSVLVGNLRGLGIAWPSARAYALCFGPLMIPLGMLLGLRLEGGAPALMLSVALATSAASALLAHRFALQIKAQRP